MKITVYYTDGTKTVHSALSVAEQGAADLILDCDFAVGIESIEDENGDTYGASWSLKLEKL